MVTENKDYLDLDLNLLEKIIFKNCLDNEVYLSTIIDALHFKFFKDKDIQQIVKLIQALYKKNNSRPSKTELELYLNSDQLKSHYEKCKTLTNNLESDLDEDQLYKYTERFLQEQAVYSTFLDIIDSKERNVQNIYDKFTKACNISINTNVGHDYFYDLEDHITNLTVKESKIKSGWNWLDEKFGGGFQETGKSLYIFAGQSNVGKSIFLSNVATNVVKSGRNVLIISLEMSEMIYNKRITSCLTGLPINHLKDHVSTLREKVQTFKATTPSSNLVVKEFPPNSITASQIEGYIKKLINKKFKPDIIVLDYLNLLAGTGNNTYEKIKHIAEDVRALTYKFECPIVTATQLNRTGYNTNDAPELDSIGESYGLGATSDGIVSIWRTEEDEEDNAIHIKVIKNRDGDNFSSTRLAIDYNTLTITENTDLNINQDISNAEDDAVNSGREV